MKTTYLVSDIIFSANNITRKMETQRSPSRLLAISFNCLLLLSQLLLSQKAAIAETSPETATPVVIESRAHYSFTSPHPDMVQSGASQSVWLEYDSADVDANSSTSAQTRAQEIVQNELQESSEEIGGTSLASEHEPH